MVDTVYLFLVMIKVIIYIMINESGLRWYNAEQLQLMKE